MKVVDLAKICHEVNKAFCDELGDPSQVPWEQAPAWQKKSAIAGVEFALSNPWVGPSALHDNWCKEKVAAGWTYGEVKDPEKKTHPCLVPYYDLPAAQRMKDVLFQTIVKQVKAFL